MRGKTGSFFCVCTALALATSAFADQHTDATPPKPQVKLGRGEPLTTQQYPAGTNLAAGYAVQPKTGYWPYQSFLNFAFNYWQVSQEGMELATNGQYLGSEPLPEVANNVAYVQAAAYKPGFTAGIGMCIDDWEIASSYTWVRSTISQTESAPTGWSPTTVWIPKPWIQNAGVSTTQLSSEWHVAMDLWDTAVSRPYYQSPCLTIHPFGGIRAAWIRQKLNLTFSTYPMTGLTLTPQPIQSRNLSHSWALGPRFGSEARCLLPMGFRLEGDFAASLLFTRYTTVFQKEDAANTVSLDRYLTYTNYDTLRPAIEAGLGLGWGRYLSNQDYHLDFSASYDFQLFWDQNMMRKLVSEQYNQSYATGNLLLQGLTVKARFDY